MPYVRWHAQDEAGRPIVGAIVFGDGGPLGKWASEPTNPCGDTFTLLAPGDYNVTFTAVGYQDAGYYPASIGQEGGPITKGLTRAVPPVVAWVPPKGAFCISGALPGSPYGDGRRVWDPAFGCFAPFYQDKMIQAHLTRGHNTLTYQVSGFPYHNDYPELDLDVRRIVDDLTRIRTAGLQTLIAFDDRRWPDLSYLADVAAATQELVNGVFGIYEVNGVVRDDKIVLDLLVQTRKFWPGAKLGVHFTDLMQGESYGLVNFTQAVEQADLNMLLFQGSGWVGDPSPTAPIRPTADVAARIADFTRRLGGPGMSNGAFWHTLSDGVVDTELYTSLTYREWMTEARSVQLHDEVMAQVPNKPDGRYVSVPCTGYLDGGSR